MLLLLLVQLRVPVLLLVVVVLAVPRVGVVRIRAHLFLVLRMLAMLAMLQRHSVVPPARHVCLALRRGSSMHSVRSVQHSGVGVVQLGQAGDYPSVQSAGLQLGTGLLPLGVFQALERHESVHAVAAVGSRGRGVNSSKVEGGGVTVAS